MGRAGQRGVWEPCMMNLDEIACWSVAPDLHEQIVKKDDWNQYRIICRGPKITVFSMDRRQSNMKKKTQVFPWIDWAADT